MWVSHWLFWQFDCLLITHVYISQIRNQKQQILNELDQALQEQTPATQQDNSHLHELPSLVIEGIPTQVDKMTQVFFRFNNLLLQWYYKTNSLNNLVFRF